MPIGTDDILRAIDPRHNAVVHAAAGTGKTWLLVSRIVRLLLAGVKPSSILAVTFTRKAAAEMRLRVNERLLHLCRASDAELRTALQTIGVDPEPEVSARARHLYEQLLVTPHELRATTFHAFCQELLARFALDAGVPPSFEVIEQTAEVEAAAWRALDRDLAHGDGGLTAAMDRFLQSLGDLQSVRVALGKFLSHRSDWWAYTENASDPVGHAARRLQIALQIDPDVDAFDAFAHDADVQALIRSLVTALDRGTTPRLAALRANLAAAIAAPAGVEFYRAIRDALYTKDGKGPRQFTVTKTLAKALGPAASEALVRDRDALLARFEQAAECAKRHRTWQRTGDWCLIGARLLHHFQEEKRSQGMLDFADLEWFTYRMLTSGAHAEWVQYKLDQRIDHLLVDEFQDTNPTQWHLLLPLLQEMAAGSDERRRSVFLVGDEKQSIYRFRRADPELLAHARDWLVQHSAAAVYDQHVSRRSSPAIVGFVNRIFEAPAGPSDYALKDFRVHETHREELWGCAALLPLIAREANPTASPDFRDPLVEPRITPEDRRREREGDLIAATIHSLIGQPVRHGDDVRPLGYGDVMILLRTRTHAHTYEAALRRAGIPYMGAGRGMFLECLEVRDILDLLRLLISPWNNVALGAVLRSPIFAASDDDLLTLAGLEPGASWYQRLTIRFGDDDSAAPLPRAARLLAAWRDLADRIPVHDLLDRIYFDADVPERYRTAAPAHLRRRIAANLTRLLDLALEADGGRFPSLARFLARLALLAGDDNESPDAGASQADDQVRILTIHAAKGLESPAVFLADAARDANGGERGVDALIEWPIDHPQPDIFVLSRKNDADADTAEITQRRAAAAFQEESNLLYVALTRAQQFLFVSGCESGQRRGSACGRAGDVGRGWYGHIERRLGIVHANPAAMPNAQTHAVTDSESGDIVNIHAVVTHGLPPTLSVASPPASATLAIDPALRQPFAAPLANHPAEMADETEEAELPAGADLAALSAAKQRGIVIHRMLERLSADGAQRDRARRHVWREFAASLANDQLAEYWDEACAVVDAPHLRHVFDPTQYREARNEVAVLYQAGDRHVTGVIDRLIIRDGGLLLLDYKTHRVKPAELAALMQRYAPQLRRYADGLRRLWPRTPVEAMIVFTEDRRAVPMKL